MKAVILEAIRTSFQRLIIEVLNDPGASWFPFFSGAGALRGNLSTGEFTIGFNGSGFTQERDILTGGTITSIDIFKRGNSDPVVQITELNKGNIVKIIEAAAAIGDAQSRTDVTDPNWVAYFEALDPGSPSEITGSPGRDVIDGSFYGDTLFGRGGNDNLIASDGSDILNGGGGKKDFYVAAELPAGIVLDLGKGTVIKRSDGGDFDREQDFISNIEGVSGSAFSDRISGDANDNFFFGGIGNDTMSGKGGADRLFGGPGGDALFGGLDFDVLEGGFGGDTLDGGRGFDRLFGGAGDDIQFGGAGQDRVFGQNGNDVVKGGAGNDVVKGNAGNDRLFGGSGDDTLTGGAGKDFMVGGTGQDVFIFSKLDVGTGGGTRDRISDFNSAEDIIRFLDSTGSVTVSLTADLKSTKIVHDNGQIILENVLLSETEIQFEYL